MRKKEATLGKESMDKALAVLSADYLTVPVDQIKDLVSVLTVVGGRPVYASGDYTALARCCRRHAS